MVSRRQAGKRMQGFLRERRYCDLRIRVQDKEYYCHRLILASKLEYFETALRDDSVAELTLPEDVDAATFGMILDAVYRVGGRPRVDAKCIRNLLLASERLRIETLSAMCEAFVKEHTQSLNLTQIFRVARALNHSSLIIYLTEYILARFVHFLRTDEFLEMSYDDLHFLLIQYRDATAPFANGTIPVHAILRWSAHIPEERRPYLTNIFKAIDLCERMSRHLQRELMECGRVVLGEQTSDDSLLEENLMPPSSSWPTLACPNAQTRGTSTLHMLLRFPFLDSTNQNMEEYVFVSLNELKVEPEWYRSHTLRKRATENAKGITIFPSKKYNLIYCLARNSSNTLMRFGAYPSVQFVSHQLRPLKIGYPIVDVRVPRLCGVDNRIYVYDTDLFNFAVPRRRIRQADMGFTNIESRRGIFCYDCDADLWSPVPAMRQRLAHCGVVTDDKLVYLIGGVKRDGLLQKRYVQAYDHRAPTWLKLARTNYIYPYEPAGCTVNGKIYLFDGKRMEMWDPNAGQWERIHCPLTKKIDAEDRRPTDVWMVPHGNYIRIFVKKSSEFTAFDTVARTWSAAYSFKNEIGPEDYCDYEDYGLQDVIYFESS